MTGQDILICGGDIKKDRFYFVRCDGENFRIVTPVIELSKLSVGDFKLYDLSVETFLETLRVTISMAL
jgi:hypothetical protein